MQEPTASPAYERAVSIVALRLRDRRAAEDWYLSLDCESHGRPASAQKYREAIFTYIDVAEAMADLYDLCLSDVMSDAEAYLDEMDEGDGDA